MKKVIVFFIVIGLIFTINPTIISTNIDNLVNLGASFKITKREKAG